MLRPIGCYSPTKSSLGHLFRRLPGYNAPHCAIKTAKHLLNYIRPFLAKADFKRVLSQLHWLNEKVQK